MIQTTNIHRKDIKYLSKDFDQFKQNLINYSKQYFPNTYTDFSDASIGNMIIEMSSYVGDVLSYYTDNQFKESLLHLSNNRNNIILLANNLGYKVKNKIPSQVNLDVYIVVPAVESNNIYIPDPAYCLTIKEGMQINAENTDIMFRTLFDINFNIENNRIDTIYTTDNANNPTSFLLKKSVVAASGNIKQQNYTFGNSAKPFDKILIEDSDIINIISITDSAGDTWYEVDYLAQDIIYSKDQYNETDLVYSLKAEKNDKRFITKFKSDGNIEIQFGGGINTAQMDDNILDPNINNILDPNLVTSDIFMKTRTYGISPVDTTLMITYATGGGIKSNVDAMSIKNIMNIEFIYNNIININTVKNSVAVINIQPASGGKDAENIEEIRQNAIRTMQSQYRAVTINDYITRAYSLPSYYGNIAKAYVIQDQIVKYSNEINNTLEYNPLAINLYVLGYNSKNQLIELNDTITNNLKKYLDSFRMLTDGVNIKPAYIINIGINFDIITLPKYNSYEVLLKCITQLKILFNISNWEINQPIILSKIYSEIDNIEGVQTVKNIKIFNKYDNTGTEYSNIVYDIQTATRNGIIYPSMDASIFELKNHDVDIKGKVSSF